VESLASVPNAKSLTYAAMDVSAAIATYADERRAQVSQRMAAYWRENDRPLAEFFRDTKLRHVTPAHIVRLSERSHPIKGAHRSHSPTAPLACALGSPCRKRNRQSGSQPLVDR
jgi:hypothetical protein